LTPAEIQQFIEQGAEAGLTAAQIAASLAGAVVGVLITPSEANSDEPDPSAGSNPGKSGNCDNYDKCAKITQDIYDAMNDVYQRYADLLSDPRNLYNLAYKTRVPNLPGTWLGHREALRNAMRNLRSLIKIAKDKGCPIPPGAELLGSLALPNAPFPR
jgi:hypothetical protein